MNDNLELRLVSTFDEFKSLEDSWTTLYKQSTQSTIFSSWDWMIIWWEVFQDQHERELFILCLYQNEKLVGIAPFQIEKSYPKSLVQGKTLRFISSGEVYEDSITSEYLDFIILPDFEKDFVSIVSKYLARNNNKWDFAEFDFLRGDALILRCFKSDELKISRMQSEYGVRFYIPPVDSFEEYQNSLGTRWRKMLSKKSRKIERAGEVIIEETNTKESIDSSLKLLADMHCSRWKDKVENCIFESSRFYDFHQKILHRLVPKKQASIKTLTLNNEKLAAYYIFEDKGEIHYYQSGFYAEYANRYSPLFLLVCKEIGSAIENNKRFDFMFDPDPQSYKGVQYSAKYEKSYCLKWTPQPIRFTTYKLAKKVQEFYLSFVEKIKK